MTWKRVALGIGNPGPEYERTRHNIGFMVLERVALRLGVTFSRLSRAAADGSKLFSGKVKAQVAEGLAPAGGPYLLVKPLTFVNLSGDVAGPLLRTAQLSPESLFVVVDDLNLPLGRIRIRPSGNAGGHNGLRSIEASLGTNEFPRLRLGIGAPDSAIVRTTIVSYVLDVFSVEEREVLDPVMDRAAEAVQSWLLGVSVPHLMDRYNGQEPPQPNT